MSQGKISIGVMVHRKSLALLVVQTRLDRSRVGSYVPGMASAGGDLSTVAIHRWTNQRRTSRPCKLWAKVAILARPESKLEERRWWLTKRTETAGRTSGGSFNLRLELLWMHAEHEGARAAASPQLSGAAWLLVRRTR